MSSLSELKTYLKFNLNINQKNISNIPTNEFDAVIFHQKYFKDDKERKLLSHIKCIKILATSNNNNVSIFDSIILLPCSIEEINKQVEITASKRKFSKSSSISVKDYLLDKNEKKLMKKGNYIVLTEKEIQLIELLLIHKEPITKNKILSLVWHYSTDSDTHTVETHIYRLRKKIIDKFSDENFIFNNKEGYYL